MSLLLNRTDRPFTFSVSRDHIATNIPFVGARIINTSALNISDHDVVAATLNIAVSESEPAMPGETIEGVPTASGGGIGLDILIILAGLLSMIARQRKVRE